MLRNIAISAFLMGVGINDAFAGRFGGWGWGHPAPEIDGSGALAAMAIVMGIGAILYRKIK
jgi:hypothetical protein